MLLSEPFMFEKAETKVFLTFVPRSFFEIYEKTDFWTPFIRVSVVKLRFVLHSFLTVTVVSNIVSAHCHSSACAKSSIKSSSSSIPQDRRTSVSVTPIFSRSSSGILACDIAQG